MGKTLLMQIQRQSGRVMEESHLLAGIIVNTNWLTFNSNLCQLFHSLLNAINAKRKVTQTTCFWTVHTLRRFFLSENLQLCLLIDTQIQLPVLTLRAIVFPDDRKAQLVHLKILCGFVVRYNDCDVVYF